MWEKLLKSNLEGTGQCQVANLPDAENPNLSGHEAGLYTATWLPITNSNRSTVKSSTWLLWPVTTFPYITNSLLLMPPFSSSLLLIKLPSPPHFNNSMLHRLLRSSSLYSVVPHQLKLSSPRKFPHPCAHFPSLLWPFSPVFIRPICAPKVLAMAERPTQSTSHSQKYTNRLAAEHSPYLLQHAHNPVCIKLFPFSWR